MKIRVRVPASSGNTGSGFDSTGMALSLYNELIVDTGSTGYCVHGEGRDSLPNDETNLCVWAMRHLARLTGSQLPEHSLELINRIPISRGLGSSSAALVSGLLAANQLLNHPLGQSDIMTLAAEIEGHTDNVVPCVLGGVVVSVLEDRCVEAVKLASPSPLNVVVWVPEFELQTSLARAALPEQVPLRDAVFNLGRAALFVAAYTTGRYDLLGAATEDRLHQPYRKHLVPGLYEIMHSARSSGALAAWLSGAGPSVIALCEGDTAEVEQGIVSAVTACCMKGRVLAMTVDIGGSVVEIQE